MVRHFAALGALALELVDFFDDVDRMTTSLSSN